MVKRSLQSLSRLACEGAACGQRLFMVTCPLTCVSGKPIMIITEFMENGALDAFLRVSRNSGRGSWVWKEHPSPTPSSAQALILPLTCCRSGRISWYLRSWWPCCRA